MSKPHLILLNPPADRIVIRDNFCSKISQASYINHPIDLLIQSGFLSEFFEITLVDAIIEKLDRTTCLQRIEALNPTGIYTLTGNASWQQDLEFFTQLKQRFPSVRLAAGGDIFLEDPSGYLERHRLFDAIVCDFTTPDLVRFFQGQDQEPLSQIVHRAGLQILNGRDKAKPGSAFEIPVPRHDIFCQQPYRYPFVRNRRFATVMTEYGCPFTCSFCVMGTLGYKLRSIENVLSELKVIQRLGIRDIFFVDQSFGSQRDRNIALCDALIEHAPEIRWNCFSRVDLVDKDVLKKMKRAGCHTIIFGVETASDSLLEDYRKGYSLDRVKEIFQLTRSLGIRTVATFLLGLPGETQASAQKTIRFARDLNCDFASINVAVPRMGTDLRKTAVDKGYIDAALDQFDQSGTDVVMETETLSREELIALKKQAVRDIYLRPGYLLRRLFAIRSWDELIIQVREGFHLLRNFFVNG